MDRKEEINKEIEELKIRIAVLEQEHEDIIKKENPFYIGDCFVKRRMIGNVYYKIIKITEKGYIYCITVDHESISKDIFVHDSFMEKCTTEKFEYEYNRTLNYITKDE